jgi:hypothetical protein
MNVLIVKLGATGDVVRTTPLLSRFHEHVSWITEAKNAVLLRGLRPNLRCLTWEERDAAADRTYDLVINLEDTLEAGHYLKTLQFKQLFGAHLDLANELCYTEDSQRWFDFSLISRFGRKEADKLKLQNRCTYQELIFEGLGFRFSGEKYLVPQPIETGLSGDVALAQEAGPVWPMKNWAHYDQLKRELEAKGLKVNVLPRRKSLLEHLCDVRNHRCLVVFNCTSPWEIYEYGIQTKIVSPLLCEYFYRRDFDSRATMAISVSEVLAATIGRLNGEVSA